MTNTTDMLALAAAVDQNQLDAMIDGELFNRLDKCWGMMRAIVPMLIEVGADAERALAEFYAATLGHGLDDERYLEVFDASVAGGLEQVIEFIVIHLTKVRGDIGGMPSEDRYDDLYRDVVLGFAI